MIPHFMIKCKIPKCNKKEYVAWHPFWTNRKICWEHRMLMVKRHRKLLDPIMKKVKKITDEIFKKLKEEANNER